ncbi:fibronectin type III domain-containing protein [Candidatus Peregrinibacteria bacterium]|nr:MAG: fibronectin type III domain-containing protein [Candidatus Peregrinibacteria bacterium]
MSIPLKAFGKFFCFLLSFFLFTPAFAVAPSSVNEGSIIVKTFSSGSARISWTSVPGADRYLIDYGMESGVYGDREDTPNISVDLVGLTLNTDYYFTITSVSVLSEESPPTSEQTFRINSPVSRSYIPNGVEGSDFGNLVQDQIEADPIVSPSFLGNYTPQEALSSFVNALMGISISIATMALLWGGILRATSAGDEEKIEKSKKFFFWSIVGFCISFSAWGIVALVRDFFPAS